MLCQQLEPPARPSAALALRFGPLYRVRGRLRGRQYCEAHHVGPRPKKPWQLTLRYDEVTALLTILNQAPLAGRAWDEVQRASLNLVRFVDFAA